MSEVATPVKPAASSENRIKCAICGAFEHAIEVHLKTAHPTMNLTVAQYQQRYPGEPIYSPWMQQRVDDALAKKRAAAVASAAPTATVNFESTLAWGENTKGTFHDMFGLPRDPTTLSARGTDIMLTKMGASPDAGMIPDIDPNYIFNLDILKMLLMGLEMNVPEYLWGHSGVGKTSIYEQIAARTGRPFIRVQHTANMEESHVIGGWQLREGKTVFELGPLPMAMQRGWMYVADEYDFARPEVSALYQAVLEGKPLMIKEADLANRVIRPHPNFRIVATGNTNGQGDESGLYQGTTVQNAANYERFGIVEKMPYPDANLEALMVSKKVGIPMADAVKLVDFATRIRTEFDGAKMSNPISPRSLLYAAQIGLGKRDYGIGLKVAFINRLPSTDAQAATQLCQRVFAGGAR